MYMYSEAIVVEGGGVYIEGYGGGYMADIKR